MRNLICLLALTVGGTAFAQSQPTPTPVARPVINGTQDADARRLIEASARADEALVAASEALRRLDSAERRLRALERTTTTTAPAPAPSAPAPSAPANGSVDGVNAEITALKLRLGVLTSALIGGKTDGETDAEYAARAAAAIVALSDPGLAERVGTIEQIVYDHERAIQELRRGRRATIGIEVQSDLGTPVEGVRSGMVNTGGVAFSLGQGFGRPDEIGAAVDVVGSTGVGYGGLVAWSIGGRAALLVPNGFEVGSEVRVGQLMHGFARRVTDGGQGVDTRVTPALYVGFRPEALPIALSATVGYGGGPTWSATGDTAKYGRSSAVVAGLGLAWRPGVRKDD